MRKKHSKIIREQVKSVYSSIAGEFDQSRRGRWHEFQYFLEYVENDVKVLDLGCGNGRLYELLKSKHVDYVGVDNNSALIKKAKENHPKAHFKMGDMVDLPLESERFDAVFCVAAFHHIPGRKLRKKAVIEMNRVLKPNGVLILTVWNLFQIKYIKALLQSVLSFILHLGLKYAWNDFWIKWGNHTVKRYYHAFLPGELLKYFSSTGGSAYGGKNKHWKIEEFYFVRKGTRVKFLRSYNLVLIARKK